MFNSSLKILPCFFFFFCCRLETRVRELIGSSLVSAIKIHSEKQLGGEGVGTGSRFQTCTVLPGRENKATPQQCGRSQNLAEPSARSHRNRREKTGNRARLLDKLLSGFGDTELHPAQELTGDISHSNHSRELQHKIARTSRSQALSPLTAQFY